MYPLTTALAEARISDLQRQACRARLSGLARAARRERRSHRRSAPAFADRFLPVNPALFHH